MLAYLAEGNFGVSGGSGALFRDGALFGPLVADGEWWRLITYGFLHAGLLHIGFNMLLLWLLGREMEPQLGTPRFLGIYFSSLLAGAFGALLVSPNAATVGASGAIFGLMGAAAAILYARGVNPFQTDIGMLILFNLGLGFFVSNVSIGGHIGGLVGGVLGGLAVAAGRAARALVGRLGRHGRAWRSSRSSAPSSPSATQAWSSAGRRRAPAPAPAGTARGCRMWASVSSPSTSRGPGRENVADASTRRRAARRASRAAPA